MQTKAKILIADDEKPTRDVMARILSAAGYETITAPDAQAAMSVISSTPDLALLMTDYKMPGENGIELGASISKKSINREVNDHMPYLSFLASNYNIESINSAAQWFEQCGIINYSLPAAENQILWNNDDRFKERLISLLNDTGVDITDIVKAENEDKSGAFVYFEHTVNNNRLPRKLKNP